MEYLSVTLRVTEVEGMTRGCWKRKIASVEKADYALAVVYGIVKEVYQIDERFDSIRRNYIFLM